jgi:hypothetical protein
MDVKRKLTPDEIDEILNQIPPPSIPISELRAKTLEEIKSSIHLQLLNQEIYESQIGKLKNYCINHSSKGFLHPGTHVGMNTGESIAAPATQLTLNASHQSGQNAKKSPFDNFKSKVGLSKDPLGASTLIHFMDLNMSYEEAYRAGKKFVCVNINSLLKKPIGDNMFNIITTDSANRDWYPDFMEANPDYVTENIEEYQGFFARLQFNTEKLLLYNITLQDIVLEMMGGNIGKGKDVRSISDFITCFCGPLTMGIIDVYPMIDPIESNFKFFSTSSSKEESDDFNVKRFFRETFEGFLTSTKIGPYQNVSNTNVRVYNTKDLIQGVELVNDKLKVWISPIVEKTTGTPIIKLTGLLELLGFNVDSSYLGQDDEDPSPFNYYLLVESNTVPLPQNKIELEKYIDDMLKASENRMIEQFNNHVDPDKDELITEDLFRYGRYCIVATIGTNLREIRAHPDVDAYRTFSEYAIEIFEVLGIEAVRNYLEREIYTSFKASGQIIPPRNIAALVDWMTSSFKPISINPKSVSKQNRAIFAQACFENPTDAIGKGAVFGPVEKITNTSAAILFGTQVNSGTGAFRIEEDPEIVEMYRNFTSSDDTGAARLTSNTLSQLNGLAAQVDRVLKASGPRGKPQPKMLRKEKLLPAIQAPNIIGALPGAEEIDDLFGVVASSTKNESDESVASEDDSFNPDDIPSTVDEN